MKRFAYMSRFFLVAFAFLVLFAAPVGAGSVEGKGRPGCENPICEEVCVYESGVRKCHEVCTCRDDDS